MTVSGSMAEETEDRQGTGVMCFYISYEETGSMSTADERSKTKEEKKEKKNNKYDIETEK